MADQLQFHNFDEEALIEGFKKERERGPSSRVPNDADIDSIDDTAQLLEETSSSKKPGPSFWTFEYYQQFFDVDTADVARRLAHSMIPRVGSNFIIHYVRPRPDLYGPWWVCVTLIFAFSIFGNLSNYFAMGSSGQDYHWSYDFSRVSISATIVFTYVFLFPAILYGFLKWRKSDVGYSYLEILSAYGYSLSVYIIVAFLWMINISYAQWIFFGLGVFLSGMVLLFTFWPALKHDNKLVAGLALAIILACHGLLAAGFKLYFFHIPSGQANSQSTVIIPSTVQRTTSVLPTTAIG